MKFLPTLPKVIIYLTVSIICCIVLATCSAQKIHAQDLGTIPGYLQPNTDSNVPVNLHTYTQSVVIEALNSVSCVVTGVDFLSSDHKCLGVNLKTGKISYVPAQDNGMAVVFANMIGFMYQPVMHTSDYFAYLGNNFIGTKKAYAQVNTGFGFQGITPILPVWVAFRNIVYLLFVVFFILVGLGIVLRVRLDPKATMNIQNELPKLIIGLILVTFSFAVAGFLIDMMYLASYVIITVMATADPAPIGGAVGAIGNPANGIDPKFTLSILNQTPMGFVDQLFHGQGDCNIANPSNCGIFGIVFAANQAVTYIIYGVVKQLVSNNGFLAVLVGIFNFGCWVTHFPFDLSNVDWGACAGGVASALAYLIVWLVLYFALLVALFRLWWVMIRAYIYILVDIALSPFLIGFGVFPGSKVNFSGWVRGMVAHLLVFPVAVFMFLLGKVFIDKLVITNGNYFTPPLLGVIVDPQMTAQIGQSNTFNIGYLIGFGIILITPTIQDQVTEIVGYQPNKHIGAALGAAGAFGAAAAGTVAAPMTIGLAKSAFQFADPSRGRSEGWALRAILREPEANHGAGTIQRRVVNKIRYIGTGKAPKA